MVSLKLVSYTAHRRKIRNKRFYKLSVLSVCACDEYLMCVEAEEKFTELFKIIILEQ